MRTISVVTVFMVFWLLAACAGTNPVSSRLAVTSSTADVSFALLPDSTMNSGSFELAVVSGGEGQDDLVLSLIGIQLSSLQRLHGQLKYDPLKWAGADLDGHGGIIIDPDSAEIEPGLLDFSFTKSGGIDGSCELLLIYLHHV
jgi:hypothetical protein